ncbi:alcohol dehydrogenase [Lentzea sp. NBRC 105346]|uniref:alcohol dehydrogenase catalytic domain-containing protein n=1 Tax=Lentzea sp. NBRC 105346 TaxID=3032205 RepID=UPI0024A4E892|nr:alcohol dehydrogenase catalytic domain-containing protein [Lentzea sp. NBRC 105346]GLZ35695.1 alcohol dehydrogenase [Lentzea sp. NBRC 105346]
MKSALVGAPGKPFELSVGAPSAPGAGQVVVRVEACGICHTDAMLTEGQFPDARFPVVGGHEVAGRVEAVGFGVQGWKPGDRVGVGYSAGWCGTCTPCRTGDFVFCVRREVIGITYRGGFAETMVVPATALAVIPEELSAVDAAPLMCAGVTTFNALRHSDARGGDLVAVLGIGGLGHVAVQFAAKLGFETVAVSRGRDKEKLALELGADHYIDSTETDVAAALSDLGGARVILSTVTHAPAVTAAIGGLTARGELIVAGATADALKIDSNALIAEGRRVSGCLVGTPKDIEETLAFCALTGVRPMVETAPLDDIESAFARMLNGSARFRMVVLP